MIHVALSVQFLSSYYSLICSTVNGLYALYYRLFLLLLLTHLVSPARSVKSGVQRPPPPLHARQGRQEALRSESLFYNEYSLYNTSLY